MRHHWERQARGRGRHGRLGRILGHGDLRYVILALIGEQPRHGYDLIKELEERTGGLYRPSAGVIYPTLNLLEDEGLIQQTQGEDDRKFYGLTDDGREELKEHQRRVDGVFAVFREAAESSHSSRPRVARAMTNLGMALQHRLSQRPITPEEIDRIVAMIDDTAAAIEKA